MILLSLLAGCWDFFRAPNEECTPEAIEKRKLVYFKEEADAKVCQQKLAATAPDTYTIMPHFKGSGNDPSGLDVDEYQDGFKVVTYAYKKALEGRTSKQSP